MASNVQKPDGLVEINKENFLRYYCLFEPRDLHGISWRNEKRLNKVGVYSTLSFYLADIKTLKTAFNSIAGYYWYLRLRGWEIDNVEWARRSFGNSYALAKPLSTPQELAPLLAKLVKPLFASRDIYKEVFNLLSLSPHKEPVRILAENCFYLKPRDELQLEIFEDIEKKLSLTNSQDALNNRWGEFVVTSARMSRVKGEIPDRIAFGGVSELG